MHILIGTQDLLSKMLQFSPDKRISVKDAIKHPFFDSVRVPAWEKESKTSPLDKELADLEVLTHTAHTHTHTQW